MFKKQHTIKTVCPLCQDNKNVHYGTNKETITVRGEDIDVLAKVYYCPDGDHFFSHIDDDENKFQYVFREYRNRKKLLQIEGIKQIRNKYKLSQQAFSAFLGFGKKTIHRYETGALPAVSHNSFIKLMKDTRNFIFQYEQIKDSLTNKLKQKIEKRINELNDTNQLSLPYRYISEPDAVVYNTTTVVEGAYTLPPIDACGFDIAKISTELKPIFNKQDYSFKKVASAA